MNIQDHCSLFHDGTILDIRHVNDEIIVTMESSEASEEDLISDEELSLDYRIKGRLHIDGVKQFIENEKVSTTPFQMKYEDAEIYRFRMTLDSVKFNIAWNTMPPTSPIKDFSVIEIQAEKIWWENIPTLPS